MNAFLDIFGLRLRLTGLTPARVPDLNNKLHWFATADPGGAADIELVIGPFQPDLEQCFSLDRLYWARPGYLFLQDSDKGLSWQADIDGLERPPGAPLVIRFAHGPTNFHKLPWRLFPDLIAMVYVLWPILEGQLAARGLYLVHAGAAERDGRAVVIAGRGGVNKTAVVAELVRRGWQPMSDDFVLLRAAADGRGTEVLALPTSPRWFQFQLRHMEDENLSLVDRLRLLRYLYRQDQVDLTFSRQARLAKLIVLQASPGPRREPHAEPLQSAAAAECVTLNCRMERTSYVGHGTMIGRFLEAYRYIVPQSAYGWQWDNLGPILAELLKDSPAWQVKSGLRYTRTLVDLIESC